MLNIAIYDNSKSDAIAARNVTRPEGNRLKHSGIKFDKYIAIHPIVLR